MMAVWNAWVVIVITCIFLHIFVYFLASFFNLDVWSLWKFYISLIAGPEQMFNIGGTCRKWIQIRWTTLYIYWCCKQLICCSTHLCVVLVSGEAATKQNMWLCVFTLEQESVHDFQSCIILSQKEKVTILSANRTNNYTIIIASWCVSLLTMQLW